MGPIAPGQDDRNKFDCIRAAFAQYEESAVDEIKKVYMLATKFGDEKKKTNVLSMFATQKGQTKDKLSRLVGSERSGNKYAAATFHAVTHGPGMDIEKVKRPRNILVKKEIINRFVAYLICNGLMTANGRTIKQEGKEDVSIPNFKRLEGKQPLIKGFEENERRRRGILSEEIGET